MWYGVAMKKTPTKLVLRSQTVRVLTNLDLTHAVGGLDSGNPQCPKIFDTGDAVCDTDARITTANHH
jgi:hypothetical protein